MYWLGIDTGTGGTRALLVDSSGREIAAVTALHDEIRMEHPLWAEQRPENWTEAAAEAIRGVLAKSGATGRDIRGVGLSGQMHGLVILDRFGTVIRPALIWCDQRSQSQVDFINRTIGKQKVLESIANPVLTGFTLPKLLWVRDHEPQHFERMRKMLLPKDYIRFWMTGEFATEVSDASGTALLDVVHRRWSFGMMDSLGLDRDILPSVHESTDITGVISSQAAQLTGLAAGNASRRRRRRSGSRRSGQRHRGTRHRLVHSRHIRRRLRPYRQSCLGPPRPRPYFLSRRAGQVACDGSDPGCWP